MRSKKKEYRIPWPLYDRSRERCMEEGYRSHARYVCGLMLHDIVAPARPHIALRAIFNSDDETVDEMIDSIFSAVNPAGALNDFIMKTIGGLTKK